MFLIFDMKIDHTKMGICNLYLSDEMHKFSDHALVLCH